MKKTLGGDRLGSGKKMQVDLRNYERSTHDLGYIVRTSMSAGTLVPFICEIGLPGDTFDINLDIDVKTHPTIGPLFGSFKVQADVFMCPIRLYNAQLHNNKLGIGMQMANIKLIQGKLYAPPGPYTGDDITNSQINPSNILAYLGIRGVLNNNGLGRTRDFNMTALVAYWDIVKNYYANKQEEIGAVIHTPVIARVNVTAATSDGTALPQEPGRTNTYPAPGDTLIFTSAASAPIASQLKILRNDIWVNVEDLSTILVFTRDTVAHTLTGHWITSTVPGQISAWDYITETPSKIKPIVQTFPLENIDLMREYILSEVFTASALYVNNFTYAPYVYQFPFDPTAAPADLPYLQSQEGLAVKTYQSDLFNNWLNTEWIDGTNGITEITAIDTSSGSFTIDTLNLSKKVYDMLNRIQVSGGSYEDWIDAVYAHDRFTRIETPVYQGGLIKELIFQEVVSNSAASADAETPQPLGTLAGKGVMAKKHKGGRVHVKVDEPCYIMALISLTPRIDYSQGNRWDVHLKTMDDLHKPALDEIGFQELITEQMAWWDTTFTGSGITTKSAGKQPAWINYMTNVNRTFGNFAIEDNEMFMTLNRRYEWDSTANAIKDLTTYIDPSKYNFIFAETSLDAQNFWTQIAVDMTVRRKMSAKVMPNL